MPTFIVDDWEHGEASDVTVAYADMDAHQVALMGLSGDEDAAAWLDRQAADDESTEVTERTAAAPRESTVSSERVVSGESTGDRERATEGESTAGSERPAVRRESTGLAERAEDDESTVRADRAVHRESTEAGERPAVASESPEGDERPAVRAESTVKRERAAAGTESTVPRERPLVAFDWDPDKHPRVPAGSPDGGEFEGDQGRAGPPEGWVALDARAESIAGLIKAGGNPDIVARIIPEQIPADTVLWRTTDGQVELTVPGRFPGQQTVAVTPEQLRSVAQTLGRLHETDPLPRPDGTPAPKLVVDVTSSAFTDSPGILGRTAGAAIQLNPDIFERYQGVALVGMMKSVAPAGRSSTLAAYTTTHEYGHAYGNLAAMAYRGGPDAHRVAVESAVSASPPISKYGKLSVEEAYAEAYTEWRLTGGRTEAPLARTLAAQDGWA